MNAYSKWFGCLMAAFILAGCGSGSDGSGGIGGSAGSGGAGGDAGADRLVVTADWLNQSLTLFDYELLVDGQSDAAAARIGTIDLSSWEPGPIELEVTPDGRTAVVSVGPAFFDGDEVTNTLIGSPDVPPGGALLIVDLVSERVTQVPTESIPLGIAISSDGALAYIANYGTIDEPGDTLSIVDVPQASVMQQIVLGGRPEQVALSPDGSLGVVNIAGSSGGIRVFETSDVAGTLSPLLPTGNDPSDVTFLDDSTRVVVANSLGLDVTLVDTSDPSAPAVIGSFAIEGGFPYGVTYVPTRDQIVAPTGTGSNLVTIGVQGNRLIPSAPQPLPGGAFPLGAAVDSTGSFAFIAHIADKNLSIVDLETGESRAITWLESPGPAYVALQP
ncbi:MAG: hypothetical protein PVH21_01000 [Myxococcales bacterium]|jgi:DNA-binding beta-propeller fold protein YncE